MKCKRLYQWIMVAFGLVLLVLVPSARAFDGRTGDIVTIGANEVIEDDLYVTAGQFTLDGTVMGDLIVLGSTIVINGTVEGDLMAGGQTIILNGEMLDDVRIGGTAVTLGENAQVADDLLAGGYSLETKAGSQVNGSLFFGGSQAVLAGAVAEDVKVGAAGLELLGSIDGDLNADVGSAGELPPFSPFMFMPNAPVIPVMAGGLIISDEAVIEGDVNYRSPVQVDVPTAVVGGHITWKPAAVNEVATVVEPVVNTTGWFVEYLQHLATLFLVGLLMLWAVPAWTKHAADVVKTKPLPSLGWGVVTFAAVILGFIVIVVAMIVLASLFGALTLGGLVGTVVVLGLLALFALAVAFALTVAYVTKIVVSYLGGRMILARIKPEWAEGRVGPLVLGLVLFILLTAIPAVGSWIDLAVVLLGLGAFWMIGQQGLRHSKPISGDMEMPKGGIALSGAGD
jgi:cytoskeletal protein CcmA (bactofilin family)